MSTAMSPTLVIQERARRRSVIAEDRGRRAPGGPAGGVDPGQERRPDREGDPLRHDHRIHVEIHAPAETVLVANIHERRGDPHPDRHREEAGDETVSLVSTSKRPESPACVMPSARKPTRGCVTLARAAHVAYLGFVKYFSKFL